jgi:hypothetical protein
MELEAGWRPDPYGRFAERWWDGTEWTPRVRTGEVEQVDPLGVSLTVPFAIPQSARVVRRRWWQRLAFWRR